MLNEKGLPHSFQLLQNYPNPFNPTTVIRFALPQTEMVTLKVYDLRGKHIATLLNMQMPVGVHKVAFGAQNFASGVYFYRIEAGSWTAQKKMILAR